MFYVRFCFFLTFSLVTHEAGEMVWYPHLFKNFPQFVVIHTVKDFSIVNEAKVDVFLELSCFSYDPTDAGNLISGSSAFSKSSSNIWKFLIHVILKPSLENLENYFASMWNGCNCAVVEHSLALSFFGIVMKTTFPVLWPLTEFSQFAGILSAALSQHHLSGFETAQLEFHQLH